MKIKTILVLIISCKVSNRGRADKAYSIVSKHLQTVDNFINSGYSEGNELDISVNFLKLLTKINSYVISDYSEEVNIPNKYNLEDWKRWLAINKYNIYWDNETEQVRVKERKFLIKDPQEEILKYFNIIDNQVKKRNDIDLDILGYAMSKIVKVTKTKSVEYDYDNNDDLPSEKMIMKWKEWYSTNKDNLIWDKKNQIVKLKN